MARSALDGIDVLLIDGNNVLHRLAGTADPAAQRTLLPRLRAAIPDGTGTIFMLDGRADAGTARRERVRPGFEIRYSGAAATADEALLALIRDAHPDERHAMTLVSDDIALGNRARALGARTRRLVWLEELIGSPRGRQASIGAGRRAAGQSAGQAEPQEGEERVPWKPGRGATRKRGNPRRGRAGPRRFTGPP
jgi:hypothetical protein